MTEDDFVTPRVVSVPQQFFVLVGFDIGSSDINTMIMLQDEGSTSPPADQNWLVSSEIDWNTFQEYLVKETMSAYVGQYNPLNFMIRPMYWYNMGTNAPPVEAPTPGKPRSVPGVDRAAPAPARTTAVGLPSFAPLATD